MMTIEQVIELADDLDETKFTKMYNREIVIEALSQTDVEPYTYMNKSILAFNAAMRNIFPKAKMVGRKKLSWQERLLNHYDNEFNIERRVVKKFNCPNPTQKEVTLDENMKIDSMETEFHVASAILEDGYSKEGLVNNEIDFSDRGHTPSLEDDPEYFGYRDNEDEDYYENEGICSDNNRCSHVYINSSNI